MVDLPTVPDRLVTTTAPQSSVSRGDIISHTNLLADAVDKVADVAMDVATRQAKKQAVEDLNNQRVIRGPDGSVEVVNPVQAPLIFGRAGTAYEEAVRAGTIAQHSNVITEALADIHRKNPADPAGFKVAAESFRDKYLEQHGAGEAGLALRTQFDQMAGQHFSGISDTVSKLDLKRQDAALSANMESVRADILPMLRGGVRFNDPAIQERLKEYEKAIDARTVNPLLAYPPEQAALDKANFRAEAEASSFIHDIDKTYKSTGDGGGYKGAMAKAETILTDPRFGMSMQQREQYYHRAQSEIRANEAICRQSINDANVAFRELQLVSAAGGRVESDDVERIAQSYFAAGDPAGAARARSAFIRKPLNDDFGRQPVAAQTQQLSAMQGLRAVSRATEFFAGQGLSPQAAAGLVGNFIHESRLDPTAVGDSGMSVGVAQFHRERADALKKFAAERGKPVTDFDTQLQFVWHELNTTERATLEKLKAAKTPEDAAHAVVGYERPAGYTPENPAGALGYESRVRHARAIFDRKPADMSLGPAGTSWLEANRARTLDDAATKEWTGVMKAFTTEGVVPSVQKVTDMVNAATTTRNAALLDQIAHDATRIDAVRMGGMKSLPEQSADITGMRAAAARGDLDPATATVLTGLERRKAAIEKGLEDDPVQTTVANFSNRFAAPPPLDVGNGDNFRAGLQARGRIAAYAAQNWQVPPRAALDSSEVQALQAVLSNATPELKARVFSDITAALPAPERMATFAKLGAQKPEAMLDAFAGGMYGRAREVSTGILTGWQAMKADPRFDPMKDDKSTFNSKFDESLPATAFGIGARTSETGALATIRNAARAYYAYQSAQIGDTSGDIAEQRVKDAVTAVTGGVLKHNSASIVAPARGMSQKQFDGVLAGIKDSDLAGVTTLNGQPITADYLRSTAQLESVGDGRYLLRLGRDPAKPVYAFRNANTEMPDPFELDLRGRQSVEPSAWPRVEFKPYPRG